MVKPGSDQVLQVQAAWMQLLAVMSQQLSLQRLAPPACAAPPSSSGCRCRASPHPRCRRRRSGAGAVPWDARAEQNTPMKKEYFPFFDSFTGKKGKKEKQYNEAFG
eukprot:15436998-Alexandrium_andersonii.AAC.1